MIIFLYGQDTYRSRRKLNEIIEHYKKIHKSGLNLKYFDDKKLDFQDFENEIQSASMFDEKKLIILENATKNKSFKNEFLASSKKFANSDNIIIFYEGEEISRNDPLFKFLKKSGQSQEFQLLEGQRLKNWVKREIKNHKVSINPKALDQLINYTGNNLWQLANELSKLANFKKQQKIELDDVELLVKPEIETDIFETIEAIALKNRKKALLLIYNHLKKGDSPLYLLSMINFQFRNLLIIKDLIEKHYPYSSILKISKLHPFVLKKGWYLANKFTLPELKKIYQKIFQVDLAIKTGKINPEIALDLIISDF